MLIFRFWNILDSCCATSCTLTTYTCAYEILHFGCINISKSHLTITFKSAYIQDVFINKPFCMLNVC